MIEDKSQEEQEIYSEINLSEVLDVLWKGKKLILAITSFLIVLSPTCCLVADYKLHN